MENRPRGREKNVTGEGKEIRKRGDGLQSGGPAGRADGYAGRTEAASSSGGGGKRTTRAPGGLLGIIVAAAVLLGGGGAGISSLIGDSDTDAGYVQTVPTQQVQVQTQAPTQTKTPSATLKPAQSYTGSGSSGSGSASSGFGLSSLFGGFGNTSSGWSSQQNTGKLNTSVAAGSRDKRTVVRGGGQDTVTIMVYMCGTDLESKYGMGTSDLQEMAQAAISDKINIIVYTGGCKQWKNNAISNRVNQIYKVERGGLRLLEQDMGTAAMTKPSTLSGFIQYCAENYPADRNDLIFWDHGGGSLSGYGYDEKNASAGSMGLNGINQALAQGGVTFDFIGFDACLMATLENALMLADYGDYLIASEETEPGVGWYYTNWLTKLSQNTSMSTLDIAKNIIDDFVAVCNQRCAGQKTTLSVIDLAELEHTAPEKLKAFATGTSELLKGSDYKTVSTARSGAREFASSSKIDQVDLVDLAYRLDTEESRALAETLLGAVKYNKTSSSISNAYGVSIYFPYQKASKVSSAVAAYNAIGMDADYARVIQQFATMEASGQYASGGGSGGYGSVSASPLGALLGGGSSGSSASASADMLTQVLASLLGASSGRSLADIDLDGEQAASFINANRLDASQLVWLGDTPQIALSEEQWSMVNDLELNVFFDDGEGYIDLGLDNVFAFTDDGALLGEYDGTWLAIDGEVVPYYHTGTVDDGESYTITGRVPVLLNGERAELLLVFDNEHPYGFIAGARSAYDESETETVAKGITELEIGDTIDYICDYYSYDGAFQDSYLLGEQHIYTGEEEISNVTLDADAAQATYLFTDIYAQEYWTPPIP